MLFESTRIEIMNSTQRHTLLNRSGFGMMLLLLSTVFLLGGCAEADESDDTTPADPKPASDLAALNNEHAETPHETAYAHVHRVNLPAGEEIAPHEGGPRVIYSLSGYTLQFETDGTATERTFESGMVHDHAGGVHSVANTGDQPASFIAFERIDGPLPEAGPAGETLDAVSLPDDATHEVMLTNDRMTVHRIALEPGASLPPHYGHSRIVYALSDYTVTFIDPDSDERTERSFSAGDVHDHEPGVHAVENTGDQRAEYLVVAFTQ